MSNENALTERYLTYRYRSSTDKQRAYDDTPLRKNGNVSVCVTVWGGLIPLCGGVAEGRGGHDPYCTHTMFPITVLSGRSNIRLRV